MSKFWKKNSDLKPFESVFLQTSETILVLPQALIRISFNWCSANGGVAGDTSGSMEKINVIFSGKVGSSCNESEMGTCTIRFPLQISPSSKCRNASELLNTVNCCNEWCLCSGIILHVVISWKKGKLM